MVGVVCTAIRLDGKKVESGQVQLWQLDQGQMWPFHPDPPAMEVTPEAAYLPIAFRNLETMRQSGTQTTIKYSITNIRGLQ